MIWRRNNIISVYQNITRDPSGKCNALEYIRDIKFTFDRYIQNSSQHMKFMFVRAQITP